MQAFTLPAGRADLVVRKWSPSSKEPLPGSSSLEVVHVHSGGTLWSISFLAGLTCAAVIKLLRRSREVRSGVARWVAPKEPPRNRGLDPKRLLGAIRDVGIGTPKKAPELPSARVAPGSVEATLMLMERRKQALAQGGPGPRPSPERVQTRLPLLIKYYKPVGIVSKLRFLRRKKDAYEDLRSVVVKANDRFELDLYHPVGSLSAKTSGLLLWSRSTTLTKQICNPMRGVVFEFEAEVLGAVKTDKLAEALGKGVRMGVTGFEKTFFAELREAEVLPSTSIQDVRSRVVIATRDARHKVPSLLSACGYKVAKLERRRVGVLSMAGMELGGLEPATPEEEAWACGLAGLPAFEYPPGLSAPKEYPALPENGSYNDFDFENDKEDDGEDDDVDELEDEDEDEDEQEVAETEPVREVELTKPQRPERKPRLQRSKFTLEQFAMKERRPRKR